MCACCAVLGTMVDNVCLDGTVRKVTVLLTGGQTSIAFHPDTTQISGQVACVGDGTGTQYSVPKRFVCM